MNMRDILKKIKFLNGMLLKIPITTSRIKEVLKLKLKYTKACTYLRNDGLVKLIRVKQVAFFLQDKMEDIR